MRVPAILSNNNEQRNIDELGVTVEVTGASYSLGRRGSQPSRTNGAIFPGAAYIVSNSMRACANQSTFAIRLSRNSALAFEAAQEWV